MSPAYSAGDQLRSDLARIRTPLLLGGILLLAASGAGAFFSPNDFFRGYLIGYLLCIGAALGSMAYLMLHYLTGGAWGLVIRRVLEAAVRTLPLLAILFIPIGFGLSNLYPWARPEIVQHSQTLQHRASYTNATFFLARAAIYLVIWILIAYFLNRWSAEQDRDPRDQQDRLARLSAGGLTLLLFSISFASIDWAESLEVRWASTMWGLMFIGAEGLTAIGFVILVVTMLSRREPMSYVLKPDHFHDLGKILFANLMLWAYFAFCQYLIVWSENLTSEIPYYLTRTKTTWAWLGVSLFAVQLTIPALLLLNRALKRKPYLLSAVVVIILVMRYMDVIWIVLPGYYKNGFRIQWMDVLTPIGLGAIWLWAFFRELPRRPLLPLHAPQLEEALVHESE